MYPSINMMVKHVYALRMEDYKEEMIFAVIYAINQTVTKNKNLKKKKKSGLNEIEPMTTAMPVQ